MGWKKSEGTQGEWQSATGKWGDDAGVQTSADSKFYGLSAGFESFSNEGKNLIIQYQAKYEKDIECGGGYVKIGPDKCGYTKRTHLIFNYKGKNVLKKSDLAYKQDDFGISHLYRLTLNSDNTVKVDIDEE